MSRTYLIITDKQPGVKQDPDTKIISPSETGTIGIDTVRELIHWAYLKPFRSRKKLAIVIQAQALTLEAQNAMLKLLEEPPPKTRIVLVADDQKNLLPTVISRTMSMKPEDLASDWEEIKAQTQDLPSIEEVFSKDLGLRFQWALKTSNRSRGEVLEILDCWTTKLREKMHEKPNPKFLDLIKKIQYIKRALKHNVNVRLALENLALSI